MAESEEDYGDDDYSQVNDYNYQNRMPNNYQHTMTKAELRRSTKPIMEKRRRARINRCLNELKSLILDALKKDPARHSKLEKADILEMTVKHLQNVQKRQLSSAMMADPAVIHKFCGGFEECATEVGRYIEGLDGIDAGVRRRLAAHLSSCVTNIPRNDNINNADTNNNSARLNAVSASLRLIPSRLPNGELALLVPDAQSLPNNVLPFFQLAEHTQMAPNLRHQSFNQVSTTTDKLPDTLRLDTSPSHPSAFTAVNKHANAERTPSPTTSVSSSVDRNASSAINNMSSEVSSTSEQPAESSTDPSSLNSSTSSLSPQNLVRNPEPLTISTKCSPNNYQNHSASSLSPQNFARNPQGCSPGYQSGNVSSQPSYLQRNNPSQHVSSGSHLKNALQSPPTAKQYQNGSKNVEDVGYNLSQKHRTLEAHPKFLYSENSGKSLEENLSQKHQIEEGYPKFAYPDFPKTTTDQGERFGSRVSQGCYTYMDAIKSQEPFPATKEQQEMLGKRHLDLKSSEFSSPLTVETNLDSVQRFPVGKFLVESVGNTLPAPIDFSKNVDYQNYFVPSLKRRRLEAASSEKGSSKSADFGEKQSFSPRIIILEEKSGNTANDDQEVEAPRNNGSEASTSDNMWRPW